MTIYNGNPEKGDIIISPLRGFNFTTECFSYNNYIPLGLRKTMHTNTSLEDEIPKQVRNDSVTLLLKDKGRNKPKK